LHKWLTRVQTLARMVEGSDLLPLHKPLREWPERAWDQLTPETLALLSDQTLDRLIVELEEICGDG
jgi:hypothetical protein